MQQSEWLPYPRYLLRRNMVRRFLDSVETEDKRILEIGYGAGDMLIEFARRGMKVEGYDFAEEARAMAHGRIETEGLGDRVTIRDRPPHPEHDTYDFIAAFEVLEHMEDDDATVQSWHAMMRQGGTALISVPAHMAAWSASDDAVGHVRRYERHQLMRLFETRGFELQTFWCYGYPITKALDVLMTLSYRRLLAHGLDSDTMQNRSKKSGVVRRTEFIHRLLLRDSFFVFFFWLQWIFRNGERSHLFLAAFRKT